MKSVKHTIRNIRNEYSSEILSEEHVKSSPFSQFERWMHEALKAKIYEPNAVTLATSSKNGETDARIVLLRDFDAKGFTFFTNYYSIKGKEIRQNKKACMNFFWPDLQRQIRIRGITEKLSPRASDAYFNTRPRESQIGAWASCQSEKLSGRKELEDNFKHFEEKLSGKKIPRPPHWGGYRLKPVYFEFWQGRPNRLHDRIIYEKLSTGRWKIGRLNP